MLLAAVANAAPVVCDPVQAQALVAEARIDERRAVLTHPWLVPGLARAAPDTDPDLRAALDDVCAGDGQTVQAGPSWQGAAWSAHSLRLSRAEVRGCTLFEQTIALTVGRRDGQPPRYVLQDRLPWSRTPIDDCPLAAAWREEQVLAGEGTPVQVVLAVDREGEAVRHSEVRLRRATPAGWHDVRLEAPAPPRQLGGFDGPQWQVVPLEEDWAVVASAARSGSAEACQPAGGQRAWTWRCTGSAPGSCGWTAHDRDATRSLLARAGQWRLAGDDGWFVLLAQAEDDQEETLTARQRRLERRLGVELLRLPSGRFPGLTPGFLVVTPPPLATREAAVQARDDLGRARAPVKRAWIAADPCAR